MSMRVGYFLRCFKISRSLFKPKPRFSATFWILLSVTLTVLSSFGRLPWYHSILAYCTSLWWWFQNGSLKTAPLAYQFEIYVEIFLVWLLFLRKNVTAEEQVDCCSSNRPSNVCFPWDHLGLAAYFLEVLTNTRLLLQASVKLCGLF